MTMHQSCLGTPLSNNDYFNSWHASERRLVVPERLQLCDSASFAGRHIQVSFSGDRPFLEVTPDGVRGSDVDVIDILASKMGFTYTAKAEKYLRLRGRGRREGLYYSVSSDLLKNPWLCTIKPEEVAFVPDRWKPKSPPLELVLLCMTPMGNHQISRCSCTPATRSSSPRSRRRELPT